MNTVADFQRCIERRRRSLRPSLILPRGGVQAYQHLPQQQQRAVSGYNSFVLGTPMVWNSAGGSGGGGTITCTSLANNAARQGTVSSSLIQDPPNGTTAVLPDFCVVDLICQFGTAPTDQTLVNVYIANSPDGTNFPSGITGTDASLTTTYINGNLTLAGSLTALNAVGTGAQKLYGLEFNVTLPYICPIIWNNGTGVAFDSTAAHTILTIIPAWQQFTT